MGAGEIRGSPLYMSPEQAAGEGTTQASDVYSFGVVVLSLLEGSPVFAASSLPDILDRVRAADADDALERARDQYPALAEVLAVCLEPDPADRYPGAGELFTALRAIEPPPFSDELIADLANKGQDMLDAAAQPTVPVPTPDPDWDPVTASWDDIGSIDDESIEALVDTTRWEEMRYRVPPHRRTWALVWVLVAAALIGATVQIVQLLFG